MPRPPLGSPRTPAVPLFTLVSLAALLAPPATSFATELTPGRHTLSGKSVQVCNVIGDAKIVPGDGAAVVVEVATHGADGGKLRVVIDECRGEKRLRVIYPSNRVVDPSMGRFENRTTTLDGCCGNERIRFTRPGDGLDARADLTIHVPRDQNLALTQAAGPIDVADFQGTLALDTGGGEIAVRGLVGALSIDSGSGEVSIEKSKGVIDVDSGSGGVTINDFDGTLSIDSGSGGVTVSNLRTDKVSIDSGSGVVSGDNVTAAALSVDSGSGGIEFKRLNAPKISFDVGSGGVSAALARSPELLHIDSGSGGVTLKTPRGLDAMFEITCSKRRLDLGVPVVASRVSDDYFEGRAGSGRGLIVIDSGSGRVSVRGYED